MRKIAALVIILVSLSSAIAAEKPFLPRMPAVNGDDVALVNINGATPAQLCLLPGVGPKLAAAIVAGRPYKALPDLQKVKGLKAGKYAKVEPFVALRGETPLTAKLHAPKAGKP